VRRDFRRRVHRMPAHRNDRNGVGIRDLSARANLAGAPRRALAPQSSRGAGQAARGDQARAARHVLRRRRRLEGDALRSGARRLFAGDHTTRCGTRTALIRHHARKETTTMKTLKFLLAAAIVAAASGALAATYKFADQGDATSMDPHSLNDSLQLSLLGNIYEPLVGRGKKLELVALLATSWKQTEPTVWRFNLRRNVKFHDGTPFTADDVIFSYERSKVDGSDMKTKIATLKEIRKIDDYTVDFVTNDAFPILPDTLNTWFIMSKAWCEKNNATAPVDVRKGKENAATLRANGTDP